MTNRCLAISNVRIYLSVWVGSRAKYSSRLQLVKYSKASVQSNTFSVYYCEQIKMYEAVLKKTFRNAPPNFQTFTVRTHRKHQITWLKTKTCDSKTLLPAVLRRVFKRSFSTVRGICQNLHYYVLKTMSDIRGKEEQ